MASTSNHNGIEPQPLRRTTLGQEEGGAYDSNHVWDRPLLRVKVTGYRLLNTALLFAFGIPKAVASYRGQTAATTWDWIIGMVLAAMMYWVGLLEAAEPPMWPLFFHTDYAIFLILFVRFLVLFFSEPSLMTFLSFVAGQHGTAGRTAAIVLMAVMGLRALDLLIGLTSDYLPRSMRRLYKHIEFCKEWLWNHLPGHDMSSQGRDTVDLLAKTISALGSIIALFVALVISWLKPADG